MNNGERSNGARTEKIKVSSPFRLRCSDSPLLTVPSASSVGSSTINARPTGRRVATRIPLRDAGTMADDDGVGCFWELGNQPPEENRGRRCANDLRGHERPHVNK